MSAPPPAQGTLDFGNSGGKLTTRSLFASPSQVTGTGTVITNGLVSDVNLVFNSPSSLTQAIPFGTTTVNLSPASGAFTALGAGYLGTATLAVSGGQAVNSNVAYLGYKAGSAGTATVDGGGSEWIAGAAGMYVGYAGAGTLRITNGATFDTAGAGSGDTSGNITIANAAGSTGTMTVDGAGTKAYSDACTVGNSGAGTLSVTNGAAFTNANSTNATVGYSGSGTARVDGAGSTWNNYDLLVGYQGTGALTITNGGTVNTKYTGSINAGYGGGGTVVVDGAGSTWSLSANGVSSNPSLEVGDTGAGTLNITNGGAVLSAGSDLVSNVGTVLLADGKNTRYANTGAGVRIDDAATVNIRGGATVTAPSFAVALSQNDSALLSINVGRGSALNVSGTLSISNGTLQVVAGASPAGGGVYTPIAAGTWSTNASGGTTTYQPVGGTWNSSTHQFTVSTAVAGSAGSPVSMDLASKQRMLISGSGASLGVSFQAASTSTPVTLTASTLSGSVLALLEGDLTSGQSILSGWTLANPTAYSGPAYLSLSTGAYEASMGLEVWGYNGSSWSAFAPGDFTNDGTYANFTAPAALDNSGYAISGFRTIPGDANLDGRVNINDLTIVLSNFGRTAGSSWSQGDFNGDGRVDVNDLTILLSNFDAGVGSSVGPSLGAVPEPTSLLLLAAGLAGLLAFARRKAR